MLIMCLLTTASAFKSVPPTNIARFDSFGAARDVLSSKDSKVNTFAVEQAAAAVPTAAANNHERTYIPAVTTASPQLPP